MRKVVLAIGAAVLAAGCMSAGEHRAAVQAERDDRLTVGKVQREIRVGMSGAEVAAVLGSPNIVTTDDQRREVWVYDRVSTETAYSESRGGVLALVLAGGAAAGAAAPAFGSSAGARSTTQRTLTVIVKYDDEKRVRDFSYHASQF